jgi:processive 1,2-diacylglycerol beta-glucosyltransferase
MPAPLKMLIMAAPLGTGHKMAAATLAREAARQGFTVVTADVFSFLPAWLGRLILTGYGLLLDWWPDGYAWLYGWGNSHTGSLRLRSLINHFLARRARAFLRQEQPQVVVVTHATAAGILTAYKNSFAPHLYVAGVVTDFVVHRWWLYPGIDVYFTATGVASVQLQQLAAQTLPGVPEIVTTGIPIRRHFSRLTYLHAREQFHWEAGTLVCLLVGGGAGLLPMEAIVEKIRAAYPKRLQLVAVTGTNTGLAAALSKYPGVTVYGYTEQLPDLLIGADVVVTKAGGLTLAEALAAGPEIIIYRPLPGQEQGNTAYFIGQGLASLARTPEEVLHLLQNYQRLPESERAARLHKRQDVAEPLAAQEPYPLAAGKIYRCHRQTR